MTNQQIADGIARMQAKRMASATGENSSAWIGRDGKWYAEGNGGYAFADKATAEMAARWVKEWEGGLND